MMKNESLIEKTKVERAKEAKERAKEIRKELAKEDEQAKVRDLKRPGRLPRLTDANNGQ